MTHTATMHAFNCAQTDKKQTRPRALHENTLGYINKVLIINVEMAMHMHTQEPSSYAPDICTRNLTSVEIYTCIYPVQRTCTYTVKIRLH
jgi:hypothetical protein